MSDAAYETNCSYEAIAERVTAAKHVALVTHRKPDGDALGSVLALARALQTRGQMAEVLLMGPLEPGLSDVAGPTPFSDVERDPPGDGHDLVMVVDTGSWAQLEPLEPWLRDRREHVIGLDHHTGGDPQVAAMRIVEPKSAATTMLILKLLDVMDVPIDGNRGGIGEALFVGLATDTGWFRFSNADARAFAAASRLIDAGVDHTRLFQLIEEQHRPARLQLMSRALTSIRYAAGGAAAVMGLGLDDFHGTGGSVEDLTSVVNLPFAVASVRVSILATENEPGRTKLSFRSKPPVHDGRLIDVNELARRFGGGGHVHAAGARIDAPLQSAIERVVHALEA